MKPVLAVIAAYVLGSLPSAYLAGKLLKGVDLRTVGSGNLGATNVYRQVGAFAAIAVLALDAGKGWAAVHEIPRLFDMPASEWGLIVLGAASILGHARPVFLLGRGGGKGVATTAGVFLALAPVALAITTAAFAIVVAVTRYVSLASIVAALLLPAAVAATRFTTPLFVSSLALSALIVWAHRANIARLRRGEEPKIGRPGGAR